MKNKGKKKLFIAAVSLVLVAAIGAGIWFGTDAGKKEPVNVYPFNYIGMTEYWGDSQESYGPVTTDKIQTDRDGNPGEGRRHGEKRRSADHL